MAKRTYSDTEKAQALAVLDGNNGNIARTARHTGIPRATLTDWANNRGVSDDVPEIRHEKKQELADKLEAIAHQLADAIPGKIADAPLIQATSSLGIAIEKMRLLREMSTDNVYVNGLTEEQRAERVMGLLNYARARRDGRALGEGGDDMATPPGSTGSVLLQ